MNFGFGVKMEFKIAVNSGCGRLDLVSSYDSLFSNSTSTVFKNNRSNKHSHTACHLLPSPYDHPAWPSLPHLTCSFLYMLHMLLVPYISSTYTTENTTLDKGLLLIFCRCISCIN